MCDTHVYVLKNNKEEKILENVDKVEMNGDELRMTSIFGEQMILNAKFKSFNSSEGKLLFEA